MAPVPSYNMHMNLPDPLIDILCCPVSHEPLMPLSAERLATLNQYIEGGEILYTDHRPVTTPLQGALISRSGRVIYAIEDGIPNLLPEYAIGTTQFKEAL